MYYLSRMHYVAVYIFQDHYESEDEFFVLKFKKKLLLQALHLYIIP